MNKKSIFTFVCLFLFFYILNYLTPMAFGDDYVYSFVWQGRSEYEPLLDPVKRISSFHDLKDSLWLHYFTWGGRTVSHFLTKFFLWMGKDVFNVSNTLIAVLLVFEIYWCANNGKITLDFKPGRLCWIFFALWAFTPGFSPVFFWLTGACCYLWTTALLLAFLLPYIQKYYFFEEKLMKNKLFNIVVFFLGIVAGWTNENSICWIILTLSVFLYVNKNNQGIETWMLSGIAGLVTGYALLIFSPGNIVRIRAETGAATGWITVDLIKTNFRMLAAVLFFQFLLWYFSLRSLFLLQKAAKLNADVRKDCCLVKILCLLSFCMTATMLFSPNFPPRSSFPGTVQLVYATCILVRLQEDCVIELVKVNAKKLLLIVGSVYFIVSSTVTFYGFYNYHMQMQELLTYVTRSEQDKENVITVRPLIPVSEVIANASGWHLLFFVMSEDENDWRNVAFARYYGLKGIRMIEKKDGGE